MDFLIEILLEVVGGIIEIFFGEAPIKRLPRPIRFIVLFIFWFGISAFLFWICYLSFGNARLISIITFIVAIAALLFGAYSIVRSMMLPTEKKKEGEARLTAPEETK